MRLTRRRAIELAGAATAVAALRPQAAEAASFSMDVPLPRGATAARGLRTLPPVKASGRFDLIGLDFGPAAHAHGELRARRQGGAWTAWTPVHDATQPCWTGPADEFQVRFTGAARRLRARFVRVGPVPSPAVAARRKPKAKASGMPDIIPRSGWGGDKLPPKVKPIYGEVQVGFVHHTVTANTYGPGDSAGIVLGIARYHRDQNGWNDIGYNFLVDRYGQIFEGRAGGMELAVVGAQAQGYNSHSTGVSCLGDYTSTRLSAKGVEALCKLLAWKLAIHGVPPLGQTTVVSEGGESNRYREGTKVRLYRISGHMDGDATSCPGAGLYDQLGPIRRRTNELTPKISSLVLRADRTETVYPDTAIVLSGTLRFAKASHDPAGAGVQILYDSGNGASWSLLQTVPTDANGAFSAQVSPTGSGRLRAVFPGDGERPVVRSTPIAVSVAPRVTFTIDPKRPRSGRTVGMYGTVEPLGPDQASLVVRRRVGKRFVTVKRRRVQIVDGVIDTSFTPRRPGRYRVTLRVGRTRVRRHFRSF